MCYCSGYCHLSQVKLPELLTYHFCLHEKQVELIVTVRYFFWLMWNFTWAWLLLGGILHNTDYTGYDYTGYDMGIQPQATAPLKYWLYAQMHSDNIKISDIHCVQQYLKIKKNKHRPTNIFNIWITPLYVLSTNIHKFKVLQILCMTFFKVGLA